MATEEGLMESGEVANPLTVESADSAEPHGPPPGSHAFRVSSLSVTSSAMDTPIEKVEHVQDAVMTHEQKSAREPRMNGCRACLRASRLVRGAGAMTRVECSDRRDE